MRRRHGYDVSGSCPGMTAFRNFFGLAYPLFNQVNFKVPGILCSSIEKKFKHVTDIGTTISERDDSCFGPHQVFTSREAQI